MGKPPARRRRSPEELRDEVIAVARKLLLDSGPAAITLQGIASVAGMAHSNITHHFGSIGSVQADLANTLIVEVVEATARATRDLRAGTIDEKALVDQIFDLFETSGAGRLLGWLSAQSHPQLGGLYEHFSDLLSDLQDEGSGKSSLRVGELPGWLSTIFTVALGTSLIGKEISSSLGLPEGFTRDALATELAERRRSMSSPN